MTLPRLDPRPICVCLALSAGPPAARLVNWAGRICFAITRDYGDYRAPRKPGFGFLGWDYARFRRYPCPRVPIPIIPKSNELSGSIPGDAPAKSASISVHLRQNGFRISDYGDSVRSRRLRRSAPRHPRQRPNSSQPRPNQSQGRPHWDVPIDPTIVPKCPKLEASS